MSRKKTTPPKQSTQKGQRSLELPSLQRQLPPYGMPQKWKEAEVWRTVVEHQPVTVLCKDAIIDDNLSSDWSIEPKVSDQREELKSEIDYYTKFITYSGDYHYEEIVE